MDWNQFTSLSLSANLKRELFELYGKIHRGYRDFRVHVQTRSEEHTSELQSRFGISYAVFCLKKKKKRIDFRVVVQYCGSVADLVVVTRVDHLSTNSVVV